MEMSGLLEKVLTWINKGLEPKGIHVLIRVSLGTEITANEGDQGVAFFCLPVHITE